MNGALSAGRSLESSQSDRKNYIKQLLELYRNTPGTLGRVCRENRRLAAALHDRGISLSILEKAFVLAAARRSFRASEAPALAPIRSMYYFVPVIDEVLADPPDDSYIAYLKSKLINRRDDKAAARSSPLKPT
jgi:hypothetical protein